MTPQQLKRCPYCAEWIRAAAVVCKHCGRELAAVPVIEPVPSKTGRRWLIGLLIILAAGILVLVASYNGPDHQAFLEFEKRRDAWNAKCDAYREVPVASSAEARACNIELKALVAEGQRRGWIH